MRKTARKSHSKKKMNQRSNRGRGFTLIELLTVMAIIVALAGLVLMSAGYAQKKAASSRAEAEIAALSAACESYKADQGIYPTPNIQVSGSIGTPSSYISASKGLYQALSGDGDDAIATSGSTSNGVLDAGRTQYMEFKTKMLGGISTNSSTGVTTYTGAYVQDPFGYSYGYYAPDTSGTNVVYNPTFDLWSTAGTSSSGTTYQARWIKNW